MFRRPAPAKRPMESTSQDVWLKPQEGENEKGARGPGGQHMGPRSKRRRHQARSEKELLAGEQHETSSDHPNPDGGKGTNNQPGNPSPRTWIGPRQALRAGRVRNMPRVVPKVTVAGHRDRGPELQNTWWSPRGEPPATHAAHISIYCGQTTWAA